MATVVLSVVGTVLGGPIGGAIGALAGRAIDQELLFKPKGREGARLAELQVQTSSYGTQVPAVYGAMRVAGTVIWATDLQEARKKSGGGKGQPSVTTYSYSVSMAVALSSRAISGVGRIWADGNLLRGAGGDFKSDVGAFRLHDGSGNQQVDPLMASAEGIALTPAHRGMAYVVFEDLHLADFGNRIPSMTFEIFGKEGQGAGVSLATIFSELTGVGIGGPETGEVAGYAASGDSARDALSPLVSGYGLSLGDDGEALSFCIGGAESEAVVTQAMLARRAGDRELDDARLNREPIEKQPLRLSVRHYDPARDYQAGVQRALRAGPGRSETVIDLPVNASAAEAKALAGARLADSVAGRASLNLHCGWEAMALPLGGVVDVEERPGRWLLLSREWSDQAVELTLRQRSLSQGAYVAASAGRAVSQPDLEHGPTSLLLADLPVLSDALPTAPVVVAAGAGASAGWRSAALFVTAGDGVEAIGATAPPAVMGQVMTPPESGSTLIFDRTSTLVVELLNDSMTLNGVDDSALIRGANLCLAGNELLQFGSADLVAPRQYRLSQLLRGRRGSEWALSAHSSGEAFLLLDSDALAFVPGEYVHIGETLDVLAIGRGDTVPAEAGLLVTGEAVRPLAPVGIRADDDGEGGLLVRWTRRSRAGWRWSDGVDAPLGEESETYEIRVSDSGGVFRSHSLASPEWRYEAGMIADDHSTGHVGAVTLSVLQRGTYALGRAGQLGIII